MEDFEDNENESEPDIEGYDELDDLDNKLNQNQRNIQREKYLNSEKLNLLLQYNVSGLNGAPVMIDPEIYHGELKRINSELFEIHALYDEINIELAEKEIEFSGFLEELINKSKQGIKLTSEEIAKIKALQTVVNAVINQYFESLEEPELEESHVYDYDSEGFIENWEYFEKNEIKELNNVIKKFKLNIKVPVEDDFKDEASFLIAWNKVWKFVSPYLPSYKTRMRETKIGTITEKIDTVSIIDKVREYMDDLKKLPIKI